MMYCKASRFHDTATANRILAPADPKEQKNLGKQVKGFYAPRWDEIKNQVALAGNLYGLG
ncbi:hypothetical protein B0H63DRAFT_485339 [Podospora didyma]|uniref:NADAR domain-containing protein n=1 Tax=Podospora didyma TaxID=330526 RepID=A0AAE0K9H2_9PEZI|nr:hypothetical protein B0H63DRAFT_485339 [Podospora didyma]